MRASESHNGVSVGDDVAGSSFDSISTAVREVAEGLAQQRVGVGAALARQRADVDLEVDAVRDDVGLGAPVGDRRREGGVRAGVVMAGDPERQLGQHAVEVVGAQERPGDLGIEVHALDELAPRLVDLRLGAELGDPADHLGRSDQRVVGAEGLRAVPRRAPDPDLGPERALLRHENREARAHRRRDLEAAGLGQHVVGVDRVALVVEQPIGAPPAQGLLVGDREVDQGAAGPEPAVGEATEGDRL